MLAVETVLTVFLAAKKKSSISGKLLYELNLMGVALSAWPSEQVAYVGCLGVALERPTLISQSITQHCSSKAESKSTDH